MKTTIVISAALLLAACSGESAKQDGGAGAEAGAEAAAAAAGSVFQTEIAPLLASNCATCHLTGEEAGNISLIPDKAIASLVNVPAKGAPGQVRVVPGDPDNSYLIHKLEGTHVKVGGSGTQMPMGAAPLPAEQIAKIRQWIKDGAKP